MPRATISELFVVGATHRIQLDLSKFMVIQVVHDLSPSKPEASPAKEPDLRRLGCDHDRGSFHNSADDIADIKAAASDLLQLFISQFVVGEFTIVGAGLPGLIAACGALLALARRRRFGATAA